MRGLAASPVTLAAWKVAPPRGRYFLLLVVVAAVPGLAVALAVTVSAFPFGFDFPLPPLPLPLVAFPTKVRKALPVRPFRLAALAAAESLF